jgi:hypothetical protein
MNGQTYNKAKEMSCSTTYLLLMPNLMMVGKVLLTFCVRKPALFSPTLKFRPKDVLKKLRNLDTSEANGPDGSFSTVLKNCTPYY